MGHLYCPCRKIGQCHPKVIIYIDFVELLSLMFHAKSQNHRTFGEDFFEGFYYLRGVFKKFEEKCCQIFNCHGKFTFSVHVVN